MSLVPLGSWISCSLILGMVVTSTSISLLNALRRLEISIALYALDKASNRSPMSGGRIFPPSFTFGITVVKPENWRKAVSATSHITTLFTSAPAAKDHFTFT